MHLSMGAIIIIIIIIIITMYTYSSMYGDFIIVLSIVFILVPKALISLCD